MRWGPGAGGGGQGRRQMQVLGTQQRPGKLQSLGWCLPMTKARRAGEQQQQQHPQPTEQVAVRQRMHELIDDLSWRGVTTRVKGLVLKSCTEECK